MTQPHQTPDFSGHNIVPTMPGFDPNAPPTQANIVPGAIPQAEWSQYSKTRPLGDVRQTIGVETMNPTLDFHPQLPAEFGPVAQNIALLWKSDETGLMIEKVGAHFKIQGRENDKWWPLLDDKGKEIAFANTKTAMANYERTVFPYLRELFAPVIREYTIKKAALELAQAVA